MKDEYNTFLGKAYRFISFNGFKKTIENESLRFTRIDSFNDPLDCSPFLVPFDWGKYNFESGLTKKIKDVCFAPFLKSSFICCFSKYYETENSYLMWSHYGKSHTQLCFEIDFSKYNYLGGPSEVNYPNDLARCRNILSKKPEERIGLFVATTKMKQWSYEEEVRLIIDMTMPEELLKTIKHDEDERYIYESIDLGIISKVIFGANSEKQEEIEIIELLNNKKYNPIFEKMILDPMTLRIKPIQYDNY